METRPPPALEATPANARAGGLMNRGGDAVLLDSVVELNRATSLELLSNNATSIFGFNTQMRTNTAVAWAGREASKAVTHDYFYGSGGGIANLMLPLSGDNEGQPDAQGDMAMQNTIARRHAQTGPAIRRPFARPLGLSSQRRSAG